MTEKAPPYDPDLGTKLPPAREPGRPLMRYHGGKWMMAPWIISHFPKHHVYVEPFGGAGSVLMRKPRSDVEIINDLDEDIVTVFRVLRDQGAELRRRLALTPFSRQEFMETYEDVEVVREGEDDVERARRVLVRQMMGFGTSGLVRAKTGFRATTHRNRNQDYSWDWARYPDHVPAFVERLRGVTIECEPALQLIDRHDADDVLFYCDPPYVFDTRGNVRDNGHNGYRYEMTDDEHRALAERLHACKAMVLLSGYRCDLYDELYGDWHMETRSSKIQDNRGAGWRVEALWFNPVAAERQPQPTLFPMPPRR